MTPGGHRRRPRGIDARGSLRLGRPLRLRGNRHGKAHGSGRRCAGNRQHSNQLPRHGRERNTGVPGVEVASALVEWRRGDRDRHRKIPTVLFDLQTFTLIHIFISVLGIIAGLVVLGGLMAGARLDGWTALFLVTTTLTSVTGFGFPAATI